MSHKLFNDNKTRPPTSPLQSPTSTTNTYSQTPPHPISIDILHQADPFLNKTPSIAFSATQDTDEDNNANAYIDHAQSHVLKRPSNLPPQSPVTLNDNNGCIKDENENDNDDHLFDRILITLARQESTSKDKRRSISFQSKKSPNIYNSYGLLPKLSQNEQLPRRKREVTTHLIEPSEHSISRSYFNTLRNCNEINANIPLPTHREKWDVNTPTEYSYEITPTVITPSPKPPIVKHHSLGIIDLNDNNNNQTVKDISLVGMPGEMDINIDTIKCIQNRGRRATIRPRNSQPNISSTYSLENIMNIKACVNDDDIKQGINGSDDSDDNILDINDNNNINPSQSELVFQSTSQSLMISCGNSREVFAILRKICIDLKKDELLPYIIAFEHKILKYDHVESFCKLLGFLKNKQTKEYICYKANRVSNRLIDCGLLECHKCLQLIHSHASINERVNVHKKKINYEESMTMTMTMTEIENENDNDNDNMNDDYIQLYELIWSITHNNNNDHMAKDVLLLCYPLVTNAKRILQCCEARFFSDDNDNNGFGYKNFNMNRITSSFNVQAKVIEFIRHWMQRYWDKDWHSIDSNNKLLAYCKSFSKRVKNIYKSDVNINKYYSPMDIQKGLRLIEMLEITILNQKRRLKLTLNKLLGEDINEKKSQTNVSNTKHTKTRSKWTMSLGNIGHSNSFTKLKKPKDLIDINYVTIAEQITIDQFSKFKLIHPRECLNQSWKKENQKHILAPNITQYISSFNKLTKWIQVSILVAENLRQRAKIIKKWVKVEQELYKLRNFQALCSVYSALSSNEIHKLKNAWSLLAKKHSIQHNMIKVMMKCTGNWKNLRRLQLETHPPMLPYFGMFAQDLIAIEETTNNRNEIDGSINWNSLWRVNSAINKHLIYQNTPYNNLIEDANIQRWIQKEVNMADELENEWMYQVSQHVSNKDKQENSKHKSTRSIFYNKSK